MPICRPIYTHGSTTRTAGWDKWDLRHACGQTSANGRCSHEVAARASFPLGGKHSHSSSKRPPVGCRLASQSLEDAPSLINACQWFHGYGFPRSLDGGGLGSLHIAQL